MSKLQSKKSGVKTSEGGKKLWIFSSSISAFVCTKNHLKIFKTRECRLVCADLHICAESGEKKVPPLKMFLELIQINASKHFGLWEKNIHFCARESRTLRLAHADFFGELYICSCKERLPFKKKYWCYVH